MRRDSRVKSVKKKKKYMFIPKSMNIVKCWNIIGPHVAAEMGGPDYCCIPYCFDTNAYGIGYIFVPIRTKVTCRGFVPVLQIIGPVQNHMNKKLTDPKWNDKNLRATRTASDQSDFQVGLVSGKNHILFTGHNYYVLSKAEDMPIEDNVTIDRSTHDALADAKWFGLITSVVVTKSFELSIVKNLHARTIAIGDIPHTVLFKYEICEMNKAGTVVKSTPKITRCKWLPMQDKPSDSLPLPIFVTGPKKT